MCTAKPEDLNDGSHRADKRDVIFPVELKTACLNLNPGIPESKIDEAIERVMNRRAAMSPIAANRELYDLIRDGVPVQFDDERGIKQYEKVRLVHFDDPKQNPLAGSISSTGSGWRAKRKR
jgi:type I restriction enzyme R subunit